MLTSIRWVTVLILSLVWNVAIADTYPSKAIRLIVPYPPGGGQDTVTRTVGVALADVLGQPVVIDNRGGAGGIIGTDLAAKAPGDGYTLLLASVGPNAIIPAANSKVPYDTMRDFEPISLIGESDYYLTVNPSVPVHTVTELIDFARLHPGTLTYASSGNLGGPHLAGELLGQLAGVKLRHIPYRGAAPAMVSTIAGETSMFFGTGPTVLPQVKLGKLRVLASTGRRRSKALPDLPLMSEVVPGFEVTQWYALLAPAGTPKNIVTTLNAAVGKVLSDPNVIRRLDLEDMTRRPTTPEQCREYIKADAAKWAKIIKDANLILN